MTEEQGDTFEVRDLRLVAIDTNIFEHLLFEEKNVVLGDLATKTDEKHINRFLKFLQGKGYSLCLDRQGRIKAEYRHRLGERIKESDDERNEIQILRYWIVVHEPHYIDTEFNRNLDKILKTTILNDRGEPETTDCIFIHMAALNQCNLVSNDSDYTLSEAQEQQQRQRDRTRRASSRNRQNRPQLKAISAHRSQIVQSRSERIKAAIKVHLNHEDTDILTSIQAHEFYLY